MNMRLIIAVGGGGHFAPALAILPFLPKGAEVLIIGRKYSFEGDKALSLEYQTAKRLGILFAPLTTGRLQRVFTRHTIPSLLRFPHGVLQAYKILRVFKPKVVLSFGGYISLPVVLAAYFLRIPVVLHEQTLEAGMANRIGSFFAKKVCVSWETSIRFFPHSKTVLTGNPVRKFSPAQPDNSQFPISNEKLPLVYITGGSAGSHAINVLVEGCINKLLEKFIVLHQTGDFRQYEDYERLWRIRNNLPKPIKDRYLPVKFVEPLQVGAVLGKADLVVARSGINTVTELIFFGKPTIFIPLPFSQNDEQKKNANFMRDLGLAEVLPQHTLTPDKLRALIFSLYANLDEYVKHAKKARSMVKENAPEKIVEVLISVSAAK
ncbi:MAG: UDP-N-acetylglucosamine--N-acetylmuramyl-(pentapeptide) pyrophosphoryl-undecaprenol N-acetylglucosamine transferase [Candidatus Levybacteria bacterium]|nr:UDP-N-acetylglucosamine--N-acetylmuramyl-(pentapeptide) pyrophosphoryl-undecaprenol N-acetylglucosamine transferase [Candidatus Levybacteria bacterium]